jgi:hypothetical protein
MNFAEVHSSLLHTACTAFFNPGVRLSRLNQSLLPPLCWCQASITVDQLASLTLNFPSPPLESDLGVELGSLPSLPWLCQKFILPFLQSTILFLEIALFGCETNQFPNNTTGATGETNIGAKRRFQS